MTAEEEDKLVAAMARALARDDGMTSRMVTKEGSPVQYLYISNARAALSAIRAAGYCVMPEEPSEDVANACDCIEAHLETAHEGFAVIIEEEFKPQLQTVVRAARERIVAEPGSEGGE